MKKTHDILREAAQTYEERNKVYGDNYIRVGKVMQAHFPSGLFVSTADDWNRLHIFLLGVVKDTRYITNWDTGGHMDSIRDRTVYSAMLEEIDTEITERRNVKDENEVDQLEKLLLTMYRKEDESMEEHHIRLGSMFRGMKIKKELLK